MYRLKFLLRTNEVSMKRWLLAVVLLCCVAAPVSAQDDCDPSGTLFLISTQKSSGDEAKDLATLKTIHAAIESQLAKCKQPSAASNDVGTRLNPVPFGSPGRVGDEDKDFEITVKEVVRGTDAWQRLKEVYSAADPAPNGKEYLLALLNVKYLAGPEDRAHNINYLDFAAYSRGRITDESLFAIPPDPQLSFDIFPGFEGEGWMYIAVPIGDPSPLIVLGNAYFATN